MSTFGFREKFSNIIDSIKGVSNPEEKAIDELKDLTSNAKKNSASLKKQLISLNKNLTKYDAENKAYKAMPAGDEKNIKSIELAKRAEKICRNKIDIKTSINSISVCIEQANSSLLLIPNDKKATFTKPIESLKKEIEDANSKIMADSVLDAEKKVSIQEILKKEAAHLVKIEKNNSELSTNYKELVSYKQKFDESHNKFLTESAMLKKIRTSINSNEKKYTAKHDIEQESKVTLICHEVIKYKTSIDSLAEKSLLLYYNNATLLGELQTSEYNKEEPILQAHKLDLDKIISDMDTKFEDVELLGAKDEYKALGNALKQIEEEMKTKLPPASQFYIYQKQNIWHVREVQGQELIQLKNSEDVIIKNISEKDYRTLSSVGKFPKNIFDNIDNFKSLFESEYKVEGTNQSSKTTEYINTNGETVTLTKEHQEDLKLIISFSEILLKVGLSGRISLSVSNEGSLGTLTISLGIFYNIAATAKLCLKLGNIQAAVKASAEIGLDASIDIKSRAVEIGSKNFQVQSSLNLGIKGSASVEAEAALQFLDTDKALSMSTDDIGKIAVTRLGAKVSAWAGISAQVGLELALYTDINNNSTKIIYGNIVLEGKFGIGVEMGSLAQESILSEDGNLYIQHEIEINASFLGGATIKVSVGILKALIELGGAKMLQICKDLFSTELRKSLMEAVSQSAKNMMNKIGTDIKETVLTAKLHLEASAAMSALISIEKHLCEHNTVVNSVVKHNNARYELCKREYVKLDRAQTIELDTLFEIQSQIQTITGLVKVINASDNNTYAQQYSNTIKKLNVITSQKIPKSSSLYKLCSSLNPEIETPIDKNKLVDDIIKSITKLKDDCDKRSITLEKEMDSKEVLFEKLNNFSLEFTNCIDEYQNDITKQVMNNFNEIIKIIATNTASKDNKKLINAKTEDVDKSIKTLEIMVDKLIKLIIDGNTVLSNMKFSVESEELTDNLNTMLNQVKYLSDCNIYLKEEIEEFFTKANN